jgi:diaminohydroxyphosphoribosylaminopyrimidine deaminase / 5-amino-6-(5-phosphoribosylamino)uracil reductase
VLVGVETVIADDPELTVRLAGYVGGQPMRVVLDSRLRISPDSRLVATAGRAPVTVISTRDSNKRLTDADVRLIQVSETDGRVDVAAAVRALEALDVASVMIEGGGQVAASFISRGLVDAIEWFRAPMVLGDEGRPAVAAFVLKDLAAAPRFHRTEVQSLGEDLWERYERA